MCGPLCPALASEADPLSPSLRTASVPLVILSFAAFLAGAVQVPASTTDGPGLSEPPTVTPTGVRTAEVYVLGPDERIALDGRLDEPVWQRIEPIGDFVQQEPLEGAPPTERTEVRLARSQTALYIGVIAFDSDPDGILAFQRRRNAGLGTDDRFMWIIDPYGDGRTAYFFETNPAGLMGDGLLRTGQGGGLNKAWDGIWEVRTTRGDYGWSAEIRIPFRTLNFDPERDVWGINFQRTVRRKNEESLWSGHRRSQGLMRPQHAGRLVGMRGLSQGVGFEARPFVTASGAENPVRATSEAGADVGVDLSYSITPNLRASLSINTDFAEVEVDQRRINLTRFPISFPEQRPFFLEAANVFSFASASGVTPFFSRRIGLVGGAPVPIRYGLRVNGQLAGTDVGLFQVRTGAALEQPGEDFTAARLRRNLPGLGTSTAGLIYTRRAAAGAPEGGVAPLDRHTLGADVDLETSRFLGDQNLQFQAFWILTSPTTAEDASSWLDRSARGVRLSFPNDPFSGHVSYRELGPAYDPAVGFVSRRGFRRLQPSISYAPVLAQSRVVRQLSWSLRAEVLTDMDFEPLTVNAGVTVFDVRFESGDRVFGNVSREFERLRAPFRVLGRAELEVPAGDYLGWSGSVGLRTASFRPVSGRLDATRETFWTGTADRLGLGTTLRPLPGLALGADYSLSRLRLASGEADVHLLIATSSFDVSPRTSLTANVQYDNVSETVGLFGRLRWTPRPGTDLFVVYAHNWLAEDGLATLERSAAAKLTYTHWF